MLAFISWTNSLAVPSMYSCRAILVISWLSWAWRWLALACSTTMICWRSISS